jgi:predicted ATP-dependent endonuclease of OLD family
MHLHRLQIINFRAIENIEVEFDGLVNVIIGPNAIGKTTILEAILLAKSVLAARTSAEGQQTMFSLGLMSPHMPQRLLSTALTNDANKPTVVKCAFKVGADEIAQLESILPSIAPNLALQSIGHELVPLV